MNILVLTIGVLLMAMSAVHCKRIRDALRDFKQWAIDNGGIGLAVYGSACGILALVISWPWI